MILRQDQQDYMIFSNARSAADIRPPTSDICPFLSPACRAIAEDDLSVMA